MQQPDRRRRHFYGYTNPKTRSSGLARGLAPPGRPKSHQIVTAAPRDCQFDPALFPRVFAPFARPRPPPYSHSAQRRQGAESFGASLCPYSHPGPQHRRLVARREDRDAAPFGGDPILYAQRLAFTALPDPVQGSSESLCFEISAISATPDTAPINSRQTSAGRTGTSLK